MKLKNVKVGTKVRVKTNMNPRGLAFWRKHRGTVGTINGTPDKDGDVSVEFSVGVTDIGHYSNLKLVKEKHV